MKLLIRLILLCSILIFEQISNAQTAVLSINGLGGTILTGSENNPKIFLRKVDALGISPNPMGEVAYDESRRGAFYSIALEITTSGSDPNLQGGQLSVTRSVTNQANSIPADALYDADFGAQFGAATDIHLISYSRPYIIRSNLNSTTTKTQRKIGVFISEDLSPGRYEADVIYTLIFP